MKKLLCKFANWILRRCIHPIVSFNNTIYINGREYTLTHAEADMSPHAYTLIRLELIEGNRRG